MKKLVKWLKENFNTTIYEYYEIDKKNIDFSNFGCDTF